MFRQTNNFLTKNARTKNLLPIGSSSRVQWIMPPVIPQNVKISLHLLSTMKKCFNATVYLQVDHIFPAVPPDVHGKVGVFYPVIHEFLLGVN